MLLYIVYILIHIFSICTIYCVCVGSCDLWFLNFILFHWRYILFYLFFSVSNISTWMRIQKCKGLYGEHCVSHIFLPIYPVTSPEATTVTSFLCSLPEILACTSKYENVKFFLCWQICICFCHAFYRYQRVLLQGWGTGFQCLFGNLEVVLSYFGVYWFVYSLSWVFFQSLYSFF